MSCIQSVKKSLMACDRVLESKVGQNVLKYPINDRSWAKTVIVNIVLWTNTFLNNPMKFFDINKGKMWTRDIRSFFVGPEEILISVLDFTFCFERFTVDWCNIVVSFAVREMRSRVCVVDLGLCRLLRCLNSWDHFMEVRCSVSFCFAKRVAERNFGIKWIKQITTREIERSILWSITKPSR
jgi:hypothetical protein